MARSKEIAPGVGRLSRSQVFGRRGLYKGLKKTEKPAATEAATTKEVQVGGEKNGGKRAVPTSKASRFYPAEDIRQPKKSRKSPKPTKLRSSITPGTVLIILAGRFAGKRVVFLKQLESGLLLITGPFKLNGVPLRRVNQAYVIATSTKVDLGEVKVSRNHRNFTLFFLYMSYSLMRRSMTRTSRSQHPKVPSLQRLSSSQRENPKIRRPSPNPSLPTKRLLTVPSLLLSRRPMCSRST